jgi:hypothetical protein
MKTKTLIAVLSLSTSAPLQLRADDPVLPFGAEQIADGLQLGNRYEVTSKEGEAASGFVISAGDSGGLSITVPVQGESIISISEPDFKIIHGND